MTKDPIQRVDDYNPVCMFIFYFFTKCLPLAFYISNLSNCVVIFVQYLLIWTKTNISWNKQNDFG